MKLYQCNQAEAINCDQNKCLFRFPFDPNCINLKKDQSIYGIDMAYVIENIIEYGISPSKYNTWNCWHYNLLFKVKKI